MDIFTSSSIFGEGFSNSIGEAMSCMVPVVVTDVGDACHIIGEYGCLIPPGNSNEMTKQWSYLRNLGQDELELMKIQARDWIQKKYSIHNMTKATEKALTSVCEEIDK